MAMKSQQPWPIDGHFVSTIYHMNNICITGFKYLQLLWKIRRKLWGYARKYIQI